jgi:LysM repeat protein
LEIVRRTLLRKRKMRVKQGWLWAMLLICFWGSVQVPLLHAQNPPTPTPDADGIITIIVQPNDALWSIAARAGIPLATLLDLNNLTEDALIQPGDRLIIAIVEPPVTPTATSACNPDCRSVQAVSSPTPSATRPPPSPKPTSPPPPPTVICLVAFSDSNGNGERDAEEPLQAGVAFTLFTDAAVVANYVTDGLTEPFCVTDLPPGTYQITRSVGREETLSNSGNRSLVLAAGDQVMLGFGSFEGAAVTPTATSACNPDCRSVQTVLPTQPPTIIGYEASATGEATANQETNSEKRPFPIGAAILIGILLIGTAVIIGRRRS